MLYQKTLSKGFIPEHVAEVGVYHPQASNIYDFIIKGIRTTLVEPDPKSIMLINEHFAKKLPVTLHTCAISEINGYVDLYQRKASTFLSTIEQSPSLVNDNYQRNNEDKFRVKTCTFDHIDKGDIDLLSVDIEGSEWFVIQNLVSRPTIISIETHGGVYTNPYLREITQWMHSNDYRIWYKNNSDSVYIKNDRIKINTIDHLVLAYTNIRLKLRKLRKAVKLKFLN